MWISIGVAIVAVLAVAVMGYLFLRAIKGNAKEIRRIVREELGEHDDILELPSSENNTASQDRLMEIRGLVGRATELRTRQTDNLNSIINLAAGRDENGALGEYANVDWLNAFLDKAKNVSNPAMQAVWAKILMRELMKPNSISTKSLDIMSNVTEREYDMLTRVVSLQHNGMIVPTDCGDDTGGISISSVRLLEEYGLVSYEAMDRTIALTGDTFKASFEGKYCIIVRTPDKKNLTLHYRCYALTSVGCELGALMDNRDVESSAKAYAMGIRSQMPRGIIVELRKYKDETYKGMRILEGDNLI